MSRAIEFLEAHQSPTPSKWREEAIWRRDNEFWLKYSRHITLQVLMAMDEQNVTQVELARRMGCTQQYISSLLKGSSNFTLETVARLEIALDIDILKSAFSSVDGYVHSGASYKHYLNDAHIDEQNDGINPRDCVDGYDVCNN